MILLDRLLLIFYGLFWLVRINGCVRRGRQPLLRGPDWFFSVRVPAGFYAGAGRGILRRYWLRMLMPFAVDIPIAIAILASGRLALLNWLILGLCALIHVNHVYSVDLAERQARPFAVADDEPVVTRMALSLTTRRLRDQMNPAVEWAIGLSFAVTFTWLARHYAASPGPRDPRPVFGLPLLLLYVQFGFLFIKRMIVAWRSPVPQEQADEYIRIQEATRRYYLALCDSCRMADAATALFWPVSLSLPEAAAERLTIAWFALWLVIGIIATVWVEIKRKQLVTLSLRARPVALPDFLRQREIVRWPVCYQPSAPMLMLKGARGYSLNLANRLAQFSAAYVAGFAVLILLLRSQP
jgi:hypothetical protein